MTDSTPALLTFTRPRSQKKRICCGCKTLIVVGEPYYNIIFAAKRGEAPQRLAACRKCETLLDAIDQRGEELVVKLKGKTR